MAAPIRYYTAGQVRELDRRAIEEQHIPGFELMQRAGKAAFQALRAQWPEVQHLWVFSGTGNNGGDGFVIAGLASDAGLAASVCVVGKKQAIKGDALKALVFARARKVPVRFLTAAPQLQDLPAHTVLVDALLGTGLTGEVRPPYSEAIAVINASGLPVLAVDIPSGLCSDTGALRGACVKADLTVTFIGRKLGLVTGAGPAMCGNVVFADLDVPPEIYR